MKRNGHRSPNQRLIAKVYANPRLRGKWLVVIHGKVFRHPAGRGGVRQLQSLLKRYPDDTPTIVYVPKAETLILLQ